MIIKNEYKGYLIKISINTRHHKVEIQKDSKLESFFVVYDLKEAIDRAKKTVDDKLMFDKN